MTTQTILDTTEYGVPSGNYDGSSQEWFSDGVTAANYYRGRGGVQTVTFSVDAFEGVMYLEGCLDFDAEQANWFVTYTYGGGAPLTDLHPETVAGNFTWMRVRVDNFTAGTINSVTITY